MRVHFQKNTKEKATKRKKKEKIRSITAKFDPNI